MSTSSPRLRIGRLAALAGVSPRSLRYYEQQGLLESERTSGGQRTYGAEAVTRIGWIQRFYGAGLCSSKISELLPHVDGCRTPGHPAPGPGLREQLQVELARLDDSITEMQRSRDELARLLEATTETSSETGLSSPRA